MTEEITVGSSVWTSDGKELGRVKNVEESAFQVDVRLASDYWLERTIIKAIAVERIDLSVAESELGGYKMDRPHDPNGFHEGLSTAAEPETVRGRTLRQ